MASADHPEEHKPTRKVRVKICGITNPDDAAAAIAFGADALGYNCYRGSKRYLNLATATRWLRGVPETVKRIAVLVNPTWEEAATIAALPFIDGLQLHGRETPQFCERLAARGIPFAKALLANSERSVTEAQWFFTDTIVLDSSTAAGFGGTGKTFPWHWARRFAAERPNFRMVLAGGLTPENVAAAVAEVRPFAVDVTSGIEASVGRKEHTHLRAFIEAAKSA